MVRLRTNYRVGENLSLYRTKATPANARLLLDEYVGTINGLHLKPRWYNAVTTNCTTVIFNEQVMRRQAWDWRILRTVSWMNSSTNAELWCRTVSAFPSSRSKL